MDNNKLLKELFDSFNKPVNIDKDGINIIIFNPVFINFIRGITKDPTLDANIIFDARTTKYYNNPFKNEFDKLIQRSFDTTQANATNPHNLFIKFIDNLKEIYNQLSSSLDRIVEFYYTYVKNNEIRLALLNISKTNFNKGLADELKSQSGYFNRIAKRVSLASKAVLTTETSKEEKSKEMRLELLKELKVKTDKDLFEIENIITYIKNRFEPKKNESIIKQYTYLDFMNYLDEMNNQIKAEYNRLIKEYNRNASNDEKIELEPEAIDKTKLKAIYTEAVENLNKYANLQTPNENEQIEIKFALASYKNLFDSMNGRWIKDKEENEQNQPLKGLIDRGLKAYEKLLLKTSPEEITITDKYEEIYNFYDGLRVAAEKYKKGEKLTQGEYDMITNFNTRIIDFQNDNRYKREEEYKDVLVKIKNLHKELFSSEIINNLKKNKDDLVRDPSKVYFSDYVPIFKMSLSLLVYLSIVMVLFILLLSIVAFFKLIYDIIINIISLFVNNDNSTRSLSIDYLSKTITRCTKSDYTDDRFYILTEQKQNLTIFNIGVYIVYLLLLYIFIYFILIIYSNVMDRTFIGEISDIDPTSLFLFLLAVIISYSVIHLVIYKYIFKTYVYIPYKELDAKEKTIDEKIASYILIYSNSDNSGESNNDILVDDEFFTILYDASRIDEMNDIFMQGVINENKDNCLEQKIIIYNIYNYLREYMVFDVDTKDKFKEYCTTDVNNKPKYTDSEIKMTFVSMMNNDEIKMIRKYNEDLPYYNQIPDDKIEYFNKLNTNINEKIKQINLLILTNTNTMIPFFLTIIYIIFIVILNIIIFYIISVIVLAKDPQITGFNEYIFKLLYYIKTHIYDRVIEKFFI
jgi:hypothetical protein